jgi:FLVCR family MFS transporter 7
MSNATPAAEVRVYAYRWIVLAVWMLCNTVLIGLWICYAPVASRAAGLWGVSEVQVGLLAMTFMYVYLAVSLPASWALGRFGVRRAVGTAMLVMGVAAGLRGACALEYATVLGATVALAAVQPFIVNATPLMVSRWFPAHERATVLGIAFVAPVSGAALGSGLTPLLVQDLGFVPTFRAYAAAAALAAALFVAFVRERPPTAAGAEARLSIAQGFGLVLRNRGFYALAAVYFLAFAIWDGIATWVEGVTRSQGLSGTQVGLIGGLLSVSGAAGSLILPRLSDRLGRRRRVLVAGLWLSLPGLLGLAFLRGFGPIAAATAWLGVLLIGCIPLITQFTVEICYPAPEAATTGVLMIASQASVVAIAAMGWSYERLGSFTPSLVALALLVLCLSLGLLRLREPSSVPRRA